MQNWFVFCLLQLYEYMCSLLGQLYRIYCGLYSNIYREIFIVARQYNAIIEQHQTGPVVQLKNRKVNNYIVK